MKLKTILVYKVAASLLLFLWGPPTSHNTVFTQRAR